MIGASAISSPATVLTAVISVGRVEISFAAFVISSQCEVCLKGAFGGGIEKIKDIAFSMEPQFVNVNSFSAKYRNKREIYTFLTVDGEVYLPPFETVTVYYLKDII